MSAIAASGSRCQTMSPPSMLMAASWVSFLRPPAPSTRPHTCALLNWHRRAETDTGLHPLLRIGIFVVVVLAVHPFQDGNGRLSRILITLLLLRAGYGHVPYSSLESIIEQNKEAYYLAGVALKCRRLARLAAVFPPQHPPANHPPAASP